MGASLKNWLTEKKIYPAMIIYFIFDVIFVSSFVLDKTHIVRLISTINKHYKAESGTFLSYVFSVLVRSAYCNSETKALFQRRGVGGSE
jgi:hypothetical protein